MKKIRLWILGSLKHEIVPSKESVEKLERKIKEVVGEEEGVVNFVWGPDLEVRMIEGNDTPLEEDIKKRLSPEQISGYLKIMEEG